MLSNPLQHFNFYFYMIQRKRQNIGGMLGQIVSS